MLSQSCTQAPAAQQSPVRKVKQNLFMHLLCSPRLKRHLLLSKVPATLVHPQLLLTENAIQALHMLHNPAETRAVRQFTAVLLLHLVDPMPCQGTAMQAQATSRPVQQAATATPRIILPVSLKKAVPVRKQLQVVEHREMAAVHRWQRLELPKCCLLCSP